MRIMALVISIAMAAAFGQPAAAEVPDCVKCKIQVSGHVKLTCPVGSERYAGKTLPVRVAAGETWGDVITRWCGRAPKVWPCVNEDGSAILGRSYKALEAAAEPWTRAECKAPPPVRYHKPSCGQKCPQAYKPPAEPPVAKTCPNGTVMEINVWDYGRMPAKYQALTTETTGYELGRGAITTTTATNRSFSREVGPVLGRMARGGQTSLWSIMPVSVQVYWQPGRDPSLREAVGTFTIVGRGTINLPRGEHRVKEGQVLVVVYPASFISPPLGRTMKQREVWFYPAEWTGCDSRQHAAHPPGPGS